MNSRLLTLVLLGLGTVSGCKRDDAAGAVASLGTVFSSPSAEVSPKQTAQLKALAELALAATRSNDLATAALTLQTLRSQPAMTAAQRMAVQDAMGQFQTDLAQRAEAGDAAAIQALNALRGAHQR